jgi:riboflavin synthase alpha subunit
MAAGHVTDAFQKSGGKARLLRISDLDGRTKTRRAAEKLFNELVSDMGGSERVSTAQRVLAEQASVLRVMAEHQAASWLSGEDVDVNGYCTTVNATRRVLCDLGLERRQADVSDLASYLSARRAATEQAEEPS